MVLMIIHVLMTCLLPTSSTQRLPEDVIPKHYNVDINIAIEELAFNGKVCIEVVCQIPTEQIKLHGKQKYNHIKLDYDMKLRSLTENQFPIFIKGCEYDRDSDVLTIQTSELKAGYEYELCIQFAGNISEENNYIIWRSLSGSKSNSRSKINKSPQAYGFLHKSVKSMNKYIIATNFERQSAFPCFDEPNLTATFTLQLTMTPPATSNCYTYTYDNEPFYSLKKTIVFENPSRVQEIHHFKKQASPSTISFFISNIDFEDKYLTSSMRFMYVKKVWDESKKKSVEQPGPKLDVDPLSEISTKSLSYLPSPTLLVLPTLKKLVSSKVGLILISEKDVMENDDNERFFNILTKTNRAYYSAALAADSWESSWLFLAIAQYETFIQIPRSRQEQQIPTMMFEAPSSKLDINMIKGVDMFQEDVIGTKKGIMLLQNLQSFMGYEFFAHAIVKFYKTRHFQSHNGPNDFWALIDDGEILDDKGKPYTLKCPPGVTVRSIAEIWTKQLGYPLVTVTALGNGKFRVSQEMFIGSYEKKIHGNYNVPNNRGINCAGNSLSYTVFNVPNTQTVFIPRWKWLECNSEGEVIIDIETVDTQLVLFNYNYRSLHRVRYDEKTWLHILNTIPKVQYMLPITRAQVVHDALSLAWMGYQEYKDVFSLQTIMKNEKNELVWQAFFSGISNLNEILKVSPDTYKLFQAWLRETINYNRIKEDIFPRMTSMVPSTINYLFLSWACNEAEDELCRSSAVDQFSSWRNKPYDFREDLKFSKMDHLKMASIFCTTLGKMRNENLEDEFDFYFELLENDLIFFDQRIDLSYRMDIIKALKCLSDGTRINRVLEWISSETPAFELASSQDKVAAFIALAEGAASIRPTLDYFYKSFDEIVAQHSYEKLLAKLVKALTSNIKPNQLEEMNAFLKSRKELNNEYILKAFEEGKYAAELRSKWLEENEPKIKQYLSEKI